MEEDLIFNADALRTMARDKLGVSLNFDAAGVRWLDGFIERRRAGADQPACQGSARPRRNHGGSSGSHKAEALTHAYSRRR